MSAKKKHYEIADKAWQCVVGCSPYMSCAPRCWARKTVARIVECQKSSNPERAEFFQTALTPDGKQWSGEVQLDLAHLNDPLKWRKPAVIATGFHGDWGWLRTSDKDAILSVMARCSRHQFMPLTKEPDLVADYLTAKCGHFTHEYQAVPARSVSMLLPFANVSIGCSVMNQVEAYKMLPHMKRISELGWRTHVWYEPALGPVDWKGWEFIELLIMGGESDCGGFKTRACDINWFRDAIVWCRDNGVAPFVKQLGSRPIGQGMFIEDRKGSEPSGWPSDLRIREMP